MVSITTYENLRSYYKPSNVEILFVGESRPHGGAFFYLGNSALYRETKKWKLRPELKKALIVANIQNYNDSFVYEDNQSSKAKNFWWLNTNPKLWSIHSISVGDEHSYTLFNDNGNKRRIYQNFLVL